MKIEGIIIIFIIAFIPNFNPEGLKAIEWKNNEIGVWSTGCDFTGNSKHIKSSRTQSKECYEKCQATPKCTHYAWKNQSGVGICSFKSGHVTRNQATKKKGDRICGINIEGEYKLRKGRQLLFNGEMNNLSEVNEHWTQETGGHGWGNNELQFYTDKNANILGYVHFVHICARTFVHSPFCAHVIGAHFL
jgi:hypothetical protein